MAFAAQPQVYYMNWVYNEYIFLDDFRPAAGSHCIRRDGTPTPSKYVPVQRYTIAIELGLFGKQLDLEKILNMYNGHIPSNLETVVADFSARMVELGTPVDQQWTEQLSLAKESLHQRVAELPEGYHLIPAPRPKGRIRARSPVSASMEETSRTSSYVLRD